MTHAEQFAAFLTTLTIEQAKEWNETVEKYSYVDDNILAPNNFSCSDRRLNAVEDRFIAILDAANY